LRRGEIHDALSHRAQADSAEGYPLPRIFPQVAFDTGAGNLGPAHLAVSILADFLKILPSIVAQEWQYQEKLLKVKPPADQLPKVVMAAAARLALYFSWGFKEQFIAPRQLEPGESYAIIAPEIRLFIVEPCLHGLRKSSRKARKSSTWRFCGG